MKLKIYLLLHQVLLILPMVKFHLFLIVIYI